MLISDLITLEDKKDFAFIFDNFDLKTLILIINENNEIFIIKAIFENNEIANIIIN